MVAHRAGRQLLRLASSRGPRANREPAHHYTPACPRTSPRSVVGTLPGGAFQPEGFTRHFRDDRFRVSELPFWQVRHERERKIHLTTSRRPRGSARSLPSSTARQTLPEPRHPSPRRPHASGTRPGAGTVAQGPAVHGRLHVGEVRAPSSMRYALEATLPGSSMPSAPEKMVESPAVWVFLGPRHSKIPGRSIMCASRSLRQYLQNPRAELLVVLLHASH